jgi:hypothetical protein
MASSDRNFRKHSAILRCQNSVLSLHLYLEEGPENGANPVDGTSALSKEETANRHGAVATSRVRSKRKLVNMSAMSNTKTATLRSHERTDLQYLMYKALLSSSCYFFLYHTHSSTIPRTTNGREYGLFSVKSYAHLVLML